jgi:hypothetical protein
MFGDIVVQFLAVSRYFFVATGYEGISKGDIKNKRKG